MLTPFRPGGRVNWAALDELVDWYAAAGAAGLFAVCLSSEMFELTPEERLAVARRVVKRARPLPVVATGTFDESPEFVLRMAETGVAAVVALTNHFAPEEASDDRWMRSLHRFLAKVPAEIRLGLYECPRPYKRLLSPRLYREVIATGRFGFLKDTSCRIETMRARLTAGRDRGLQLYNANTPTLLASLRAGADGYSGIAANYFPALYAWLVANHAKQPSLAEKLSRFLTVVDPLIGTRYPASAKRFLHDGGLRIGAHCRVPQTPPGADDTLLFGALHAEGAEWHRVLGIDDPLRRPPAALKPR